MSRTVKPLCFHLHERSYWFRQFPISSHRAYEGARRELHEAGYRLLPRYDKPNTWDDYSVMAWNEIPPCIAIESPETVKSWATKRKNQRRTRRVRKRKKTNPF
jgi:hypothetical protein